MSGEFRSGAFFAALTVDSTNFENHELVFVDSRAADETVTRIAGPFISGTIVVKNDGSDAVEFSFGKNTSGAFVVHGRVLAGEELVMRQRYEKRIFLRKVGANVPVRIFVW